MDREIVYSGAIPQDVDQLSQNKNVMIGLGYLIQAILGISTWVDGLACTPTGPAGMTVNVAPGSIYALENVDGSAYGSLAPDTTHQIMKQGLSLNTTNLSCPAPATSGQSIVYLIEAAYEDVDGGSVVLPYYNASNPAMAYNGPNNTGVSQNTVRQGVCLIQVKAGVAATTGTQATPAPDAGFTGLFAVTVANGQTTITSGSISQLASAPFINPKLTAVLPALQSGAAIYAADTSGAANTVTIALAPALSSLGSGGQTIFIKMANTNTGAVVINTNGLGNVAATLQNGSAIPPGGLKANGIYHFVYDGNHWQLQEVPGAALGQCQFQYTSATTATLVPKNGNKVSFPDGTIQSIGGGITLTYNNCSIDGVGSSTLAANTQYYVYLVAGNTPVLDCSSATAYATDAVSGIIIKNGDSTRVLVGRAVTNGAGQFLDQDGARQVYSWFNKQKKSSKTNFTANRTSGSTSNFAEIGTDIRNTIAPWSGDPVEFFVQGNVGNSSTETSLTGVGFDGTTAEAEVTGFGASGTAANDGPLAIIGVKNGLTEALHYATLLAWMSSGTATYYSATSGSSLSAKTTLTLVVMG